MNESNVATLPQVLRRAAREHADVEALVDGATRLTYAELLGEVERVAAALLARGVRPGDRLAVWAPNSARWALTALACFHVGITLLPINTRYRGPEARDLLARTRTVALFVEGSFLDQDYIGMLRDGEPGPGPIGDGPVPGLPHLRTIVTLAEDADDAVTWSAFLDGAGATDAGEVTAAADAVAPDTVLEVLFTSGTTGRPKGVLHTQGQVVRVYRNYGGELGLRPRDRYLLVNPFFHSFGLLAGVVTCMLTAATVLPVRRLDTAEALALIERERITGVPGPPTLYAMLLNDPRRAEHDLSSLRLAVTGASSIPSELVRRMRGELGFADIITAYGLTECTGVGSMCRLGDPDEVVERTSGRALPGTEITIAAVGGSEESEEGTGEILIRGYNVMAGYFEDPAATADAIDPDGWLHTRDVGHLDELGNLHITDRLDDMFIVGGFNTYPAEIEQVLVQHPAVSEAAVLGVPDERLGKVGQAFVVARYCSTPTEEELVAFCRERLANFKVPRSVVFLPELPKAASGKVAKSQLRRSVPSA